VGGCRARAPVGLAESLMEMMRSPLLRKAFKRLRQKGGICMADQDSSGRRTLVLNEPLVNDGSGKATSENGMRTSMKEDSWTPGVAGKMQGMRAVTVTGGEKGDE
jgi:hypothetical protein